MIKSCNNCGYSSGRVEWFGQCRKTGWYCTTQRKFPNRDCDSNFSGWTPKEKNWIQKLFSKKEKG